MTSVKRISFCFAKISILKQEGVMEKISYERRVNKSVILPIGVRYISKIDAKNDSGHK